MTKRILLIVFFIVNLILKSQAGTFTYSSRLLGSAIANNATLFTYDDQYFDMSAAGGTGTAWHAANNNNVVSNYIHLKYTGADNVHYTSNWWVQIIGTVDRWDENGTLLSQEPCTLKVEYNVAAGTKYVDVSSYKNTNSPGHKMQFTIAASGVTTSGISIPTDLMIESVIDVDRTHDIDANQSIDISNTSNSCTPGTSGVNSALGIEFHWDYVEGAEEYDLEWLFKSYYDADATLDFSEATRITTSNQYYAINNVYDDGYIYYRIRAVAKDFTTSTSRLEAAWTESENIIPVCNIEKRNWSYNSAFAEEGKRKEVMTYFDGSTRSRQSITLSNTENIGLVSESMYDYEGRPALQTLPAPSRDYKNDLRFYEYFSLNTSSTGISPIPYTKKDFDNDVTGLCGTINIPGMKSGITSGNGAANYYSENNILKSTGLNTLIANINADGTSFPFSQTIYSPDGNVKLQSGPGTSHKVGSTHETQYLNGSAAQEKLDRLFGNEVGYAEHYREKAVIDPNGQVSVSYENLSGQVVATCLRGNSPANLQALGTGSDIEPYMDPVETYHSFVNNYDPTSESYISQENFVVTDVSTNYNFTYKVTAQQFAAMCHDTTYSCQYFLQLTIKDDCNESVTATSTVYTTPITPAGIITAPALNTIHHLNAKDYTTGDFQITFTVDFPKIGVYRIEKRLWLDETALNEYLVLYEQALRNTENECITPLDELETIYEAGVDLTECMSCEQYVAWELEQPRDYPYTDQSGNIFADSVAFEAFLLAQCHVEIPARNCNGLLAALKADMSPGGQYFEYIIGSYTAPPTCGAGATFTPAASFVSALIYMNTNLAGSCSTVDVVDLWNDYITEYSCSSLPSSFDVATLTAAWDPCWANFLVQYHPEYCRYQRCVELTRSYDYDAAILNTTYAEAITLPNATTPYLDITTTVIGTSVLDQDPFFVTVGSLSAITDNNPSDYNSMNAEIGACAICNTNLASIPANTTPSYDASTPMWTWALIAPVDISGMPTGTPTEIAAYNTARWKNYVQLYIATKAQLLKVFGCEALPDNTYPPDNLIDGYPSTVAFGTTISIPGSLIHTFILNGLTINDPEPINNFQAVIDDINANIAASDPNPVDDYDNAPDLCIYNSSSLSVTINTSVIGDAVVPNLAPGCGTPNFFESYTLTTPTTSGDVTYAFYVKIDSVPFNYPIDNKAVEWINSDCYFRISNEFTLPSMTGLTDTVMATHLNTLKLAVNNYISSPYDFTCTTSGVSGGIYSYSIVAPTALGPLGKPGNLDILVKRKVTSGTETTICSSQYLQDFSTAAQDCNPSAPYAPNCLCIQLNQIHEFYESVDSSGYITINEVTYSNFQTYAAAQLNSEYSPDTTITAANVNYWWSNCSLNEDAEQTFMQSPLELNADGAIVEGGGNSENPIPSELDCSTEEPCQQQGYDEADFYASEAYEALINQYIQNFIIEYKKACLHEVNLGEEFKVVYDEKEYHYTLYYYDQAGNLVRTIPPSAVQRIDLGTSVPNTVHYARLHANDITPPAPVYPEHSRIAQNAFNAGNLLVTNYKYNSLNQLVEQETPDGGLSKFWYNDIGQLRFSQNAKQFAKTSNNANGQYSYTIYDGQGRIKEVGENYSDAKINIGGIATDVAFYLGVNQTTFPTAPGTEVTKTYYDDVVSGIGLTQAFLRKRVSTSTYEDIEDASDLTFNSASHYSYDVHGNVNILVQDYPELEVCNNRFKTIEYGYDLISGNVNNVTYQEGAFDQYYHRYEYDANNRITHAYTSNNKIHWQQDARYFYYLHGPLARIEIGEEKVQGLDYAYNVQGWIKSVNANSFAPEVDPGKDGYSDATITDSYLPTLLNGHKNISKDVFGYSLSYFDNDYKSIGTNALTTNNFGIDVTGNMSFAGSSNLYNGNIKAMSTAMYKPVTSSNPIAIPTMAKYFEYDQLNRIKEAQAWEVSATSSIGALTAWTTPSTSDYYEGFNYDANGNILYANRNGYAASATNMDALQYVYSNLSTSNKLSYVNDNIGFGGNYGDDIDDQLTSNYAYDEIGNLITDNAEDITNIEWTVYGKIKKITKGSGLDNIEFKYDASGNRIAKIVKPKTGSTEKTQEFWTMTYYTRDAQGNTLGVYNREMGIVTGPDKVQDYFTLSETSIYGSSRLGIEDQTDRGYYGVNYDFTGYNEDGTIIPDNSSVINDPIISHDLVLGNKRYELSNHLGNVNVVISDRKLSIDLVNNTTLVSTPDGLTDNYLADVLSNTDYYSFGATMPGRSFVGSSGYRYGFNGKENDNEVKGQGNQQDYGLRIYDTRLGKFLSVDPLTDSYPYYTPYQFAGNMPIRYVDLDGGEPMEYNIAGMIGNDIINGFIGIARWIDETLTYPISGGAKQNVNKVKLGPVTNETNVTVTKSATTSTHLADKLTYIKNNNTNKGDPTPITSTTIKTEVEVENKTSVAWQNGTTNVQVYDATKVNNQNVRTNTTGTTVSGVVDGVPMVIKASKSSNTAGTTTGSTTMAIGTKDNNAGVNVTSTTTKNGAKSTAITVTGEVGTGSTSATGSAGVDIKTTDPPKK